MKLHYFKNLFATLAVAFLTCFTSAPTASAAVAHELIASFDFPPQYPGYGALALGPDGYYWGSTTHGGANNYGTIYKVKVDGSDWQVVLSFTNNAGSNKGTVSHAALVSDGAGSFWGTTFFGGASGKGTVFKVNTSTGVLTTVVEFTGTAGSNKGANPFAALLSDGAGSFWGTTTSGGASNNGTVFKVNESTGVLTTVVEFTGTAGSNKGTGPHAGLASDGAGSFWGTTSSGGAIGCGTVFKVNASTGVLTTVVEFTGTAGSNKGASPDAGLASDGAGSFWGTTYSGGASGKGTVFKVNTSTGVLTTVVEFTGTAGSNKGANPFAALLSDGAGSFWGTTTSGGASNNGTVFKVNVSTGVLTTVVEFTGYGGSIRGDGPNAGLVSDGAGFFWGTTISGGAGGVGTVFKVNATSGVLTTLVDFTRIPGSNKGLAPIAALASDGVGSFWGTTYSGGASNFGTMFKVNATSGVLSTVVEFTGYEGSIRGAGPYGLVSDGAGYFWGTTTSGRENDNGTVFKVNASTGVLTTLVEFTGTAGSNKGSSPAAGLVSDGAGFFWGTTDRGGASDYGTVFKVNASTGVLTTVAEFTGTAGSVVYLNSNSRLVSDGVGSFWGTTRQGGTGNKGTVFKVNASTGVLTTVVEFTGTAGSNKGAEPFVGLASDGAGSFWGTTYSGGASGKGTVFKVNTSTGVLTTVVEFTGTAGSNKGANPFAALLSDGAGSFWGTTTSGGASNNGTVFKVNASSGVLTTLMEFTGNGASNKGASPRELVSDGAGTFYGTTAEGGPGGGGTVYRLTQYNTSPVVTLESNNPLTFEAAATYTDAGATVSDQEDGTLTPTITSNTVASNVPGSYLVTWSVTDSGGLTGSATRTVNVVDTTPPSISETFSQHSIAPGSELPDYRTQTTATDALGVVSFTQSPDPGTVVSLGVLPVTLTATDAAGNIAQRNFSVTVANQPQYTSLATKGGAVPNAGVSGSGVQAGGLWTSFGVPSVNEAGQVAFLGSWKAPAVTGASLLPAQSGTGIFVDGALVVKKGDAVPGIANAVYGAFKDPLLGPDGSVAWIATLANAPTTTGAVVAANSTVICLDADGTGAGAAVVVARKGALATGAAIWKTFTSVALGQKAVAFTGVLESKTAGISPGPGGATTLNDSGLWVYNRGTATTTLALREEASLLGSNVKTIAALSVRPGSLGQGHGVENDGSDDLIPVRVTLADNRQAVGTVDESGVADFTYVTDGDATGYGAGAKWLSFGIPTQNVATAMAFVGRVKALTGTATSTNNSAIFAHDDVTFTAARMVSKGDTAIGVTGGIFSALKDPVSASNRSVAFLGTMKADVVNGITGTNNDGIWRTDDTNGLSLVAREGAQPPETPAGAQWKVFTSLALPEGRGPIFVATMHSKTAGVSPGPGGITTANDIGLWATDSTAALRLLLQEGDPIGTSTVKTMVVLSSVAGSFAQTRSFNSGGSVLVKVTDLLGAQHLLHIAVP